MYLFPFLLSSTISRIWGSALALLEMSACLLISISKKIISFVKETLVTIKKSTVKFSKNVSEFYYENLLVGRSQHQVEFLDIIILVDNGGFI